MTERATTGMLTRQRDFVTTEISLSRQTWTVTKKKKKKPPGIWGVTLLYSKAMCLLWVTNFLGSHHRHRAPSDTDAGFHHWIHMSNQGCRPFT